MSRFLFLLSTFTFLNSLFGQVNMPQVGTNTISVGGYTTIYDNGGANGIYSNSCNGTLIIYPQQPGYKVSISFTSFYTESGGDVLYVYDGTSISAPLLLNASGNGMPSSVVATNSGGALLLNFISNSTYNYQGFAVNATTTLYPPRPDFLISSFLPANDTLAVGVNYTNTSIIRNTGFINSSCKVSLYLSSDTVIDVSDVILSNYTVTINNSSQANSTFTLTVPSNTTPGYYYFILAADADNKRLEYNENDNQSMVKVLISAPNYDLKLSSLGVLLNPMVAGVAANEMETTFNYGNSPTGTCDVNLYLSADTIIDGLDYVLNSATGPMVISPSGSGSRNMTYTVPVGYTPGNYYMIASVDPNNLITELNENNNVGFVRATVQTAFYDLGVSNFTCTATVSPGGVISIGAKINNLCNMFTPNLSNVIYLSQDTIYDVSDISLFSNSVSLTQGTNYALNYNILINSTTAPGNYYVIVRTDANSAFAESNETNNFRWLPLTINPLIIDLYGVTGASFPSRAIPSNGYSFPTVIYNNSMAGITANLAYYLSSDTLIDGLDVMLGSSNSLSISANYSANFNAYLTIPGGTVIGNYYILFKTDYLNLFAETNELNNIICRKMKVVSADTVDLAMPQTGVNTAPYVTIGNNNTPVNVFNNSAVYSGTYSNFGLYFSSDSAFQITDTLLFSAQIYSLGANSIQTLNASFNIASNYSGKKYIIFYADKDHNITERDESNNIIIQPVYVVNPFYDLQILSCSGSSSATAGGSSFPVTSLVKNNGSTSTSGFNPIPSLGIYLSTDSVYNPGDHFINSISLYNCIPGTSSSYASSIVIPTGVAPGNYYLVFYADYTNLQNEPNELDNFGKIPITVLAPNYDFVYNSSAYTQSLNQNPFPAGSTGTFTITATSAGTSTAMASAAVYLSADSILDPNDWLLSSLNINFSVVGGTINASCNITVPSNIIPGNYYFIGRVDNGTNFAETNENNNTGFISVSIGATAFDLSVKTFSLSTSTCASGVYVTGGLSIFNFGNTNCLNDQIYEYLSSDTILDVSDILLSSFIIYSQSPNTVSANQNIGFTIPASTAAGNYYIIVKADGTNQFAENSETNNTRYLPISVQSPFIDIVPLNVSLSTSFQYPGTSFQNLCFSVKNNGNATANPISCNIYLSTDSVWSVNDIGLGSTAGNTYAGQQIINNIFTPNVSASTLPGNYYYVIYCDAAGNASETNENNNFIFVPFTVMPPVIDLSVSSVSLTGSYYSGNSTYIYYTLQNSAPSPANSVRTGFYISQNQVYDTTDVFVGYDLCSMPGNQTTSRNFYITIPSIPGGPYYVIAFADYQNTVVETSETNNITASPATFTIATTLPDLNIYSLSVSSNSVALGGNYSINCQINNGGNANFSGNARLKFFLSADNLLDSTDFKLRDTALISLNQGYSAYFNLPCTVPMNISIGNYYVFCLIDSSNTVVESNENNNSNSLYPFHVYSNLSDLIISNFNSNNVSQFAPHAPFTMYVSVKNLGNSIANAGKAKIFFSTDTLIDASDIRMDSVYVGGLNSGYYNTFSFQDTIPNVAFGTYYLIVKADADTAITELNENNNLSRLKITVTNNFYDYMIDSPFLGVDTIFHNGNYSLSFDVYNLGFQTIAINSHVGFYLSSDTLLDATDSLVGGKVIPPLANSGSSTLYGTINASGLIPSGNYYLLIYADDFFAVSEGNENNNMKYLPVYLMNGSVSVKELETEKAAIYPNPAGSYIIIKSAAESGVITIYNSLGEAVLQTKSKNTKEQIDISKLNKGIYFIELQTNGKVYTSKFVKE